MIDTKSAILRQSLYVNHVTQWLKYFPRKQIHIVDGDQFRDDPVTVLSKLETFLGIEHRITKNQFTVNEQTGLSCVHVTGHEPLCLGSNKGRSHPKLTPGHLKKLQDYYQPYNKKFFKLVGHWFKWKL